MDASSGRKIEVFEPFSRAFDLTKLILFQPFDLAKWFGTEEDRGQASFLDRTNPILQRQWQFGTRPKSPPMQLLTDVGCASHP